MTENSGQAGLYLHIPFCSDICPYCDFFVLKGDADTRTRFVAALVNEIEHCPEFRPLIDTIYFGGGTPSLLEGDQIVEILAPRNGHMLQF